MAGRIVKKCEESIEKPDFWPHREYCNLCRGRDKDCEVVRRGICIYSGIVGGGAESISVLLLMILGRLRV